MTKTIILLLFFLVSCTVSQYAQLKEGFNKEKPAFWKYDEKKDIYSTPLNKDQEVIFWKQYKEYLTGKDTIFVLKEFGKPNSKDKNSLKYFTSPGLGCNDIFIAKKEVKSGTGCSYIVFDFDENHKLKGIKATGVIMRSEE